MKNVELYNYLPVGHLFHLCLDHHVLLGLPTKQYNNIKNQAYINKQNS